MTFVDNGNGTATFSGTPAPGTGSDYTLTVDAHNGVLADAVQTLTLNVDQPPTITSPDFDAFRVNTYGTATVTTTGFPDGPDPHALRRRSDASERRQLHGQR